MVNDQNQLKLLIIYLIQIKKKVKDQMAEVTLKPQLVAIFTTFNNIESFNTNNCNFKNKWTGYTS